MRYMPAAVALSVALALVSSVGHGAPHQPEPRAAALAEQGRSLLASGNIDGAIDNFEAALTIDPGFSDVFLGLAEAARAQNLQGKAIRYYREALSRDPGSLSALAGEGAALAEKGAMEKARRNLARLETLCGSDCEQVEVLNQAIARGPVAPVQTAEAVPVESPVATN